MWCIYHDRVGFSSLHCVIEVSRAMLCSVWRAV